MDIKCKHFKILSADSANERFHYKDEFQVSIKSRKDLLVFLEEREARLMQELTDVRYCAHLLRKLPEVKRPEPTRVPIGASALQKKSEAAEVVAERLAVPTEDDWDEEEEVPERHTGLRRAAAVRGKKRRAK